MSYLTHAPAQPLDQLVEYMWLISDAPPHDREQIVPSGTLELVVNLREDEIRIYERERAGPCQRFSGMVVSGAYGRPFAIDTAEHASAMGVHFRPGRATPFLGIAASDLADAHVDASVLWGRHAAELRERLCLATTHAERFRLLESALLTRVHGPSISGDALRLAVDRLGRGGTSVREIVEDLGLSHRRFIEVFAAEVGMTPKLFCRVRRFQRVIAAARAGAPDWSRLALESGYFDQSHLIRDFSAFCGLTPTEFLRHRSDRVKENHVAVVGW